MRNYLAYMRLCYYLVFSLFFLPNAFAQHNYFVYLQTENKQPFSVRLNEKTFSSSAAGYVIIPKLVNGTYKVDVQFPKNEIPGSRLEITIKDRDEGFLLKNFDPNGWGLFNMQTMDITMGSVINLPAPKVIVNKGDAFSNALAEVTNTPAINSNEEIKTSLIVKDSAQKQPLVEIKKDLQQSLVSTSEIHRVFTILDNSGRSSVYTILEGNRTDTVRCFIPYLMRDDTTLMQKENLKQAGAVISKDEPGLPKQETQKVIRDTLAVVNPVTNDSKAVNGNNYSIAIINASCKAIADEWDFLKLRKKMAAENTGDDMIAVAKKYFKSKCYSTEQVKNLGLLFLNNEGRYNFFEAAYDHVSNPAEFKDLQSQLSEAYFITRFKAMLR